MIVLGVLKFHQGFVVSVFIKTLFANSQTNFYLRRIVYTMYRISHMRCPHCNRENAMSWIETNKFCCICLYELEYKWGYMWAGLSIFILSCKILFVFLNFCVSTHLRLEFILEYWTKRIFSTWPWWLWFTI